MLQSRSKRNSDKTLESLKAIKVIKRSELEQKYEQSDATNWPTMTQKSFVG